MVRESSIPPWYWRRGLHDARILNLHAIDLSDNRDLPSYYTGVELEIDSSQAMYDTSVAAIRFYNYKILTCDVPLNDCWWISDSLQVKGRKYLLQIDVGNPVGQGQFVIRFESCSVRRTRE